MWNAPQSLFITFYTITSMSWLVAQRYSFDLSSGRPGFNPQTCSNYFFYIFQFFSMSFSLLCYFDYSNIDVRNTTKEFVSNFTNDWNIGHLSLKLWAMVSPKGLDNYFHTIPIWTRYDPTINLAYDPSLCYKVFCGYNSNKMCCWSFFWPKLHSPRHCAASGLNYAIDDFTLE